MSRICGDPKFKILISVEKINLPFKREKKKKTNHKSNKKIKPTLSFMKISII